jgi:hypothetical protein
MSTTVRDPETKPTSVQSDSERRTAFIGGSFYLITFISSIPALFLLKPVVDHRDFIISAGSSTGVLWGNYLDLINALTAVGSAVALYPILKRQNESLAIGFVASRLLEGAIIFVGVVSLLSVVSMRQADATGAEAASLVIAGQSLVNVHDWVFLLGPGLMPAFNALLLGTLMYRSGLVPRIIPILGLIGAPLLLMATTTTIFGVNDQLSLLSGIGTAPIFVWELSLGLWLVLKGFKPSPILTGGRTHEHA